MTGERTILCGTCKAIKPIPKTLIFIDGLPMCSKKCAGNSAQHFNNGRSNGRAKINEKQAREILASALSPNKIAEIYNISRRAVNHIKSRKSWKHI